MALLDCTTETNMKMLIKTGKKLLKAPVGRVNTDTGEYESIPDGPTNEKALEMLAAKLSRERKLRRLTAHAKKHAHDRLRPQGLFGRSPQAALGFGLVNPALFPRLPFRVTRFDSCLVSTSTPKRVGFHSKVMVPSAFLV